MTKIMTGILGVSALIGGFLLGGMQAFAQEFRPVNNSDAERTAVYMSMAEKIQHGYPMGVVVFEQQKDAALIRFDVSDLVPSKAYRVDAYDGGSCHVLAPYGDKEWQAAIGQRVDITLGNLIKSGEPLAMIFATDLGLVKSGIILPQYHIRQFYDKALVIREGQSVKGKIIACGEIAAGQPVPIDGTKGITVERGDSSDNRKQQFK